MLFAPVPIIKPKTNEIFPLFADPGIRHPAGLQPGH
jgi:hypothetical protein